MIIGKENDERQSQWTMINGIENGANGENGEDILSSLAMMNAKSDDVLLNWHQGGKSKDNAQGRHQSDDAKVTTSK